MKYVNQPVRKTDAMSLVTGKPVYTDDLAPKDCLIVKILRSPHANAWVEEIKTGNAEIAGGSDQSGRGLWRERLGEGQIGRASCRERV